MVFIKYFLYKNEKGSVKKFIYLKERGANQIKLNSEKTFENLSYLHSTIII